MKTGISTASFFNRIPTEDSFDVLQFLGVNVTEIFLNTYSEYEIDFIEQVKKRLNGIEVHSLHVLGSQFEPELFSFNERVRADAEKILIKVLTAAKLLGAKYYTFHGPLQLKRWAYKIDYDSFAERLKELNAYAENFGVNISFENVHWAYGNTPEFFEEVLKRYPSLYTTLDIKQAILGGIEPDAFLRTMGKNISTIHICDVKDKIYTALPSKGDYNFDNFFKKAAEYKLNAAVLIESYSRDYEDYDELKAAYDYIKALTKKYF